MQRTSQINETSKPIEKIGKEYEQNRAEFTYMELHMALNFQKRCSTSFTIK